MADRARLEALFSGTVQGVGFRFTAVGLARSLPVTGFVRNLDDGRVELVAEGERPDLEALAASVKSELRGYIRSTEERWTAATGEFTRFEVRH